MGLRAARAWSSRPHLSILADIMRAASVQRVIAIPSPTAPASSTFIAKPPACRRLCRFSIGMRYPDISG